jgi:hypothetical protein
LSETEVAHVVCRAASGHLGEFIFIARYSVASVKASSAAIVDDIELAVALPAEAVTAVGSVSQSETDMN